jgi:hypothetical protein
VVDVGFSSITTVLTITADLWEFTWVVSWSISVTHRGSVGNTLFTTVGMVFWATPVITVEGLSFTSGVVVAACWVVVSSLAAVKIMAGAAVTFSNTLSRVVSLTSDITGEAFVTTLSIVFVNPGVDLIDLLFHFCVVLNNFHKE